MLSWWCLSPWSTTEYWSNIYWCFGLRYFCFSPGQIQNIWLDPAFGSVLPLLCPDFTGLVALIRSIKMYLCRTIHEGWCNLNCFTDNGNKTENNLWLIYIHLVIKSSSVVIQSLKETIQTHRLSVRGVSLWVLIIFISCVKVIWEVRLVREQPCHRHARPNLQKPSTESDFNLMSSKHIKHYQVGSHNPCERLSKLLLHFTLWNNRGHTQ